MHRFLYKDALNLTKGQIRIHFLCWLVFLTFEIVVSGFVNGFLPFIHYFLFYLINIGIFYAHSVFLLRYVSPNVFVNALRIPIFVILELTVYVFLAFHITQYLNKYVYFNSVPLDPFSRKYISLTSYRGMCFVLYGTGYYFLTVYIRRTEKALTQTIENEQLKNEVLRAEQDFLRAQINPHLLFNTLSFIKYAVKRKPEEADEAVMRLSDIMGFALENNSKTILLTKELEQVENIIGLNQLRFNHTLNIKYISIIENEQATIIPIILLTLVENIFKHGNLLDDEHPAEISVKSTEEFIFLQTSNLPLRNGIVQSNHTGLINIDSRLDQFYKNSYFFQYGLDDKLFKVNVKINLKLTPASS